MPETITKTVKASGGDHTSLSSALSGVNVRDLKKMWRFDVTGTTGTFAYGALVYFVRAGVDVGAGKFIQELAGSARVQVDSGTPVAGDVMQDTSVASAVAATITRTVGTIRNNDGEIHRVELHPLLDTTRVDMSSNWGGDARRYVHVVNMVPHGGTWNESSHRLESISSYSLVEPRGGKLVIEGMQFSNTSTNTSNSTQAIDIGPGRIYELHAINCLFRKSTGITTTSFKSAAISAYDYPVRIVMVNCLVLGGFRQGLRAVAVGTGSEIMAYNNTIYGADIAGIQLTAQSGATNVIYRVKNNIVQGATIGDKQYEMVGGAGQHGGNKSGDATSPDADGRNLVVAFRNVSSIDTRDLHLDGADTAAKDKGISLVGDATYPFGTDAKGTSRPQGTAWDAGALEALAAAVVTYNTLQPLHDSLNLALRGSVDTSVAAETRYVALGSISGNSFTEIQGAGYARAGTTFAIAAAGASNNAAAANFPTPTGPWSFTHFCVMTQASGGQVREAGKFAAAQGVAANDTVSFAAGALLVNRAYGTL